MSVQRITNIAITGAMRTTVTDVLEVHAKIMPIELLMQEVCHRAALRLITLPKAHPLHRPVHTCTQRMVKRHPSPLHKILHALNHKPDKYETIYPIAQPPKASQLFTTDIAQSREDSKEDDKANMDNAKIYTDGSGREGGVGAAAVMYKGGKRSKALRYHLGTTAEHTTYKAEAIGVTLALERLTKEKGIKSTTIYLENQAVIQSIGHIKSRPAQQILEQAHNMANQAARPTRRHQVRLRISWISGHDGVEGNEAADAEAKEASMGNSSMRRELPTFLQSDELPHSVATTRQTLSTDL
jgi:ribonuclease HI